MKTIGDSLPRRLKATASGAITAGKPVIVEADGDVAEISQSTQSVGSSTNWFDDMGACFAWPIYDSVNNQMVFIFKDGVDGNDLAGITGTLSGTTITFDSKVDEGTTLSGQQMQAALHVAENKIVIAFRDSSTGYGRALVATLSSGSVSFGTQVVFNSASTGFEGTNISYDSTAEKVVIAYRNLGSSNRGEAIVGTVSGSSISFGSASSFNAANTPVIATTYIPSVDRHVIAYYDGATPDGRAVVATVSGTSISFGSESVFESSTIGFHMQGAYVDTSGSERVVLTYQQGGKVYGIAGEVSTTAVTWGTRVLVNNANSDYPSLSWDSAASKLLFAYEDTGGGEEGRARPATISGSTITLETEFTYGAGHDKFNRQGIDTSQNKIIIVFQDSDSTSDGQYVVFQHAGISTLTSENYIGIAEYAAADTETATLLIKGGVSTAQSSLTPGQTYFVQGDGTLGLTADSPSVTAGTAVTSTKLIVKG